MSAQEEAPLSSEARGANNNPCPGSVLSRSTGNPQVESTPLYLRTTGEWLIPFGRCPHCAEAHSHIVDGALTSPLSFSAPCGGTYRVRMVRVQLGNELRGWAE